jgi:hypothetical protein
VDPDRWLWRLEKRAFARTIRVGGDVTSNPQDDYVSRSLAGQRLSCMLNAAARQVDLWQRGEADQVRPDQRLA